MLCKKPFIKGLLSFGCGQCLMCRINRRRLWQHRMMLETLKHPYGYFITLTYSDEFLPPGGSLEPKDVQLWLKRVRKSFGFKLRYFLVGEYGETTWRPHYHVCLWSDQDGVLVHCADQWGLGHIHVGELNKDTAGYTAGYVTKKMSSAADVRLKGRHPEFARMSLKPGIGFSAMEDVAKSLTCESGQLNIIRVGDVPGVLKHGGRDFALGRYLKKELRRRMNVDEQKAKNKALYEWSTELQGMYSEAIKKKGGQSKTLRQIVVAANRQLVLNKESRFKIFANKKGRSI